MPGGDPIQCPECGWTGYKEGLLASNEGDCPICENDIEVID